MAESFTASSGMPGDRFNLIAGGWAGEVELASAQMRRSATTPPVTRAAAALVVLGLLLPVIPLEAKHPPFSPDLEREVSQLCRQVLAAGVFNRRSLACYPQVWHEVENALCSVDVGDVWLPFAAGFGVESERLAPKQLEHQTLVFARYRVHPAAWSAWRAKHCRDVEPTTSIEADWGVGTEQPEATYVALRMHDVLERTQDAFAAARAVAPPSLVERWESCALLLRELDMGGKPGVHCRLIGSDDTGTADETLYFSARRIYHPASLGPWLLPFPLPRLFAPKLRRDLEIEGARCEGPEWRQGMRIKGHHTLRCKRLGTSDVTFRLTTSKGDCTETLPAAGDPPWDTTCAEADLEAPAPELPFGSPP